MTREEIEDFAAGNGLTFEDAVAVLSTMGETLDEGPLNDGICDRRQEHRGSKSHNRLVWFAIFIIVIMLIFLFV